MSIMIDLHNELNVLELAPALTRTTSSNGTGVDLQGYQGEIKVILNVGAVSGTSPTLDVKIQDSADNSTFADVSGLAFSQKTSTGTDSIAVDTRAVRRYIRAVMTIGGTSPSFTCAVLAVGQKQSR